MLQKFIDNIFSNKPYFCLKDNMFFPLNIEDNKKYIYWIRDFNEYGLPNSSLYSYNKPVLVACVNDNVIYLIEEYILHLLSDSFEIPYNDTFRNFYIELNIVQSKVNQLFYDKIETISVDDSLLVVDEKDKNNQDFAWMMLCEPDANWRFPIPKISENDFINLIFGKITTESFVNDYIKTNYEKIYTQEILFRKRRKYINDTYKDSKMIELYHSLKALAAKTVNVTFSLSGKTASGKIDRNVLMSTIYRRRTIHFYNFVNSTAGEKLLKNLNTNSLTLDDISKVTFNRKVLYEK